MAGEAAPQADPRWLRLILPAAAAALVVGWAYFLFVCDDAYIAFRYIANRREGWGYVWNPPPFAPVEGYTSFLWVVLLDLLWTVTGVAPPVAAPIVGLVCALGTTLLTAWMAWQAPLPASLARWRPAGLALVLLGVLSNKTFLVWTSSGLETPLFVLLHVAWVAWAMVADRGPRWVASGATIGAALALTRPDGLLYLAATAGVVAAATWAGRAWRRADLLAALPLLTWAGHLVWRRATYGEWLPNTYYAKVAEPWSYGGGNHFWLYMVENMWFAWLPLLAVGAWRYRWRAEHAPAWVAFFALAAHTWYYVYRVGGDHFEFRIYAHVPVLVWVGTLVLVGAARLPGRAAALVMLLLAGVSDLIPWTDQAFMRQVETAEGIKKLHLTLADRVPLVLRPWAALHDELEGACTRHILGIPHQTHRLFRVITAAKLQPRAQAAEKIPRSEWEPEAAGRKAYPVVDLTAVGVAAWRLPYVAIIDRFGLNDKVIARNLPKPNRFRYSAHDRFPPPGYVECFAPNVKPFHGLRVEARKEPFGPEDVVRCEAEFFAELPRFIMMTQVSAAAEEALYALREELDPQQETDAPAQEEP